MRERKKKEREIEIDRRIGREENVFSEPDSIKKNEQMKGY